MSTVPPTKARAAARDQFSSLLPSTLRWRPSIFPKFRSPIPQSPYQKKLLSQHWSLRTLQVVPHPSPSSNHSSHAAKYLLGVLSNLCFQLLQDVGSLLLLGVAAATVTTATLAAAGLAAAGLAAAAGRDARLAILALRGGGQRA
eukprot:376640-Pleurochrysis_carterae.AAC.1